MWTRILFQLAITLLCSLPVEALDGIVVPPTVDADHPFDITFHRDGSDPNDQFRVFLAAASVGQNGPMCMEQALQR